MTRTQIIEALRLRCFTTVQGGRARLEALVRANAPDGALSEAVARELGQGGFSNGHGQARFNGNGLRIWLAPAGESFTDKPTFAGKQTLALCRELFGERRSGRMVQGSLLGDGAARAGERG